MRVLHYSLTRLAIGALLLPLGSDAVVRPVSPIATIQLFNPTRSLAPAVVEVPVGQLAIPKLVDWRNVRLMYDGMPIPFALREGKAHWRAELSAPITVPRAE